MYFPQPKYTSSSNIILVITVADLKISESVEREEVHKGRAYGGESLGGEPKHFENRLGPHLDTVAECRCEYDAIIRKFQT